MAIFRVCLLAFVALIAACTTGTEDPGPGPVYFVMRHLDTPEGERDPDLTAQGRRRGDLTAQGQRRAALLPDFFFEDERPAAIYVSDFRRTRQTAAPLAARLGLTPIVYDPADTPALVARVRAGPLPALIVGHSNTVPDIIEALGGHRPPPLVHADFGDVWRIGVLGLTAKRHIDAP
jgi:phosphohistidine phosphatase SixA